MREGGIFRGRRGGGKAALCACVCVTALGCTRADEAGPAQETAEPGAVVTDLPTAQPTMTLDELIEAHVDALGGRDLIDSFDTLYYEVVPEDGSGAVAVYRKRPRLMRLEYANGLIEAFDGESGWYREPGGTPSALPPERSAGLRRSAAFDDLLPDCSCEKSEIECRLVGWTRIPQGPAWEVEIADPSAPWLTEHRFLDAGNFLEVRRVYQSGSKEKVVTFSDYAPVDGLMLNGAYTVHAGDEIFRYRINAADYGRAMPDELFELGRQWLWGWSATPTLDEDSVNPLPPSSSTASRPPPPPPLSGHERI